MISPVARKQLNKIRKDQKEKIVNSIRQLESDPFKSRAKVDIKKLIGIRDNLDLYRLRVGNYRITYEISEDSIWISEILKRSAAYKFLL
jgi:mRNA-degrading endonuclease RelE of RelBE toxin-antitoxin system